VLSFLTTHQAERFASFKDTTARAGEVIPASQYNQIRSHLKAEAAKNIQLSSQVVSLEEELKQYNQYMRDAVVMYRRQVEMRSICLLSSAFFL
jgi:hypothetical protein